MARPAPEALLDDAVATGRVHSAYLLSGPGDAPRRAALRFARGLACRGGPPRPCDDCAECRRSTPAEAPIELDGAGKRGPLYRHVGDHPDLLWVERGAEDTRVRIGQVRALQAALRLRSHEGGFRVAVLADAEWLNQEAQNALLRVLEEPPARTALVLVAASASGLLATVRSRCQKLAWPTALPDDALGEDAPEGVRAWGEALAALRDMDVPQVLDLAERCRGARAAAAAETAMLLEAGSLWLRARTRAAVQGGARDVRPALQAFAALQAGRKALAQRNANPQLVAERALLALREAAAR